LRSISLEREMATSISLLVMDSLFMTTLSYCGIAAILPSS
jgi:hypothetical protein